MVVVYSATRNLYPYLPPAYMSLLAHNPDIEKIYLLIEDDKLPYAIPKQCECINVSGQQYFKPDECKNYDSVFTYMALIRSAFTKYFPHLDRIISLDVDTIVCDSIQPMWDMDLEGKWFAAVPEWQGKYRPYGNLYYNFGVVVYNLKQIREDGVDDKVIEFLNTTLTPYCEQDAFQKFNDGTQDAKLDARYNEAYHITMQTNNPAIVHYAGCKQWWLGQQNRHEYYDFWAERVRV